MKVYLFVFYLLLLWACNDRSSDQISFNRDIRPILNEKCLRCHGGVKTNGDFSLLFEEDAFASTQSGKPAIIPGNHRKSELYRRLVHEDPQLRMPYEKAPLTPSEIKVIATWIDQGAKWEKHWAYVPPSIQIKPPEIQDNLSFVKNDLDLFVLDRLKGLGLSPNSPAALPALYRRIHLDLTGLPPNQAEISHYINDRPDYEQIVDNLLQSTHFGERWAAMWLDLARYADTKGYEKDQNRQIWKFRDYVINAFNENKPFDQFTIEQLAGDLIENPSSDQIIATAFHRNSISNDEGGTDDEEFRTASVIERVSTTYEVWQSTTMACVQCHSHPYDPFRHEDFYRSMAYFNNAEDRDNYNENPKWYSYERGHKEHAIQILDWLYEHIPKDKLPKREGSIYQQKFALLEKLDYRSTEAEDYDGSSPFIEIIWPEMDMLWQTQDSSWVRFDRVDLSDVYRIGFIAATQLDFAGSISVHRDSLNGEEIGRVKIRKTGEWDGWEGNKPSEEKLLKEYFTPINATQGVHDIYFRFWVGDTYIQHLFYLDKINYYKKNATYLTLGNEVLKQIKALDGIPATSTPIIRELPEKQSRKTYVFDRGSWLSPSVEANKAIPTLFTSGREETPGDRLAFAQWLVSEKNPLTSRVIVNRIWEQIFGRGLVETMEEFGSQGDQPTHPELLDWLAHRLVHEFKWHLKPLIREIVLSGTYRQSSELDSLKLEIDPDNRWLSRGARIRLNSEQLRDQILTVSGLLNPEVGGPSVIIPQLNIRPSNIPGWALTDETNFNRRSLYIFWKRTDPYANMITFDSPDRTTCTSKRISTNTPLQALNLLNDETYLRAAFALAKKMKDEEQPSKQITCGYQMILGKDIEPKKLQLLLDLYHEAKEKYMSEVMPEFIQVSDYDQKNKIELAALTLVANTLFNLDEFIVKE